MKLTNSTVPVYTVSGSNITRDLPDWQANKRKIKKNPEYANRVELLQDFEFEEASLCVRIAKMATG
jgi:ribosome biogenesis protein ENP2